MIKTTIIALAFFFVPFLSSSQNNGFAVNTALEFLNNLENGNFESNKKFMAPLYAIDDYSDKLANSWKHQIKTLGPYLNLKSTKYDYFRDYEIVYLLCEFQDSDYTLKLVYNNRQEITDIYFIPYPPLIAAGDLNSLWIIMFFILWELAWKAMGLWKAGKKQKVVWFLAIFILPTFGLLPIFYIHFVKE